MEQGEKANTKKILDVSKPKSPLLIFFDVSVSRQEPDGLS